MQPERLLQIEELFHLASERPASEWEAFLKEACREDARLYREVALLLDQSVTGPMDQPVMQMAGSLLNDSPENHWADGARVGTYEILGRIGAGGMGEVYKARDTRLKRIVAIKVMRDCNAGEQERLRFLQEARAASALSHPNIVQIYELGSIARCDYIVMEFIEGQTLAQRMAAGALGVHEVLDYAGQIAAALAAAHATRIVHRDIKPANIIVTGEGVLKILDFGLAKIEYVISPTDNTVTAGPVTNANTIMGTAAYMSPEQAEGKAVDARSDIFSTGATLYEMFCGRRAFDGDSAMNVLSKVLRESPPQLRTLRPEIPKEAERIVAKCLEKDPQARYETGSELLRDLKGIVGPSAAIAASRWRIGALAAGLVIVTALAGWLLYRNSLARWSRNEALPQIRSMVEKDDLTEAFELTKTALSYTPDDPDLKQLWFHVAMPVSLNTTPPGAQVSYRPYGGKSSWKRVGITPLKNVLMPWSYMSVRIEKQGWETLEIAAALAIFESNIALTPLGQLPEGMVAVPENSSWANPSISSGMQLPDYFLDKYEVTNKQFKKFINEGGYRDRKHWPQPFRRYDQDLQFDQAMLQFRDATGRQAPAGWELGAFPANQPDFPVSGVSWYEAVAYCQSVGKSLPTVPHWKRAAGFGIFAHILLHSNFKNAGPAPVGANSGVSPFGAFDMAGNVKEWLWNSVDDRRAILGGGWNEPSYMFDDADAQDPFTRGVAYGFRCAKYPVAIPPAALDPIKKNTRDYSKERPVDDKTFETFQKAFAYDKTPLEAKTDYVDDTAELWRKEKVSFRTVYGERMSGYLYLPRNAKPPYQTVILAPSGGARFLRSSETGIHPQDFSYLLQTGRAVFHPVFKGTYERRLADDAGPVVQRDAKFQFAKDTFQSIDYLESRPEIDHTRIGYYGTSFGAWLGIFPLAFETRLKAAVLNGCGLLTIPLPPEVDIFNFAPRVRLPVLMLNGKYDFAYSLEEQTKPLFRLLGTPGQDKKQSLFDGGHVFPVQGTISETLAWYDRYLGPVELK